MFCTINDVNPYDKYHLILTHKDVPAPVPKRNTLSIPLSDGEIDATKFVSDYARYENRKITMIFEMIHIRSGWESVLTNIYNDLQGKSANVVFYNNSYGTYFWKGTLWITGFEDHGASLQVTMTLDANPFKTRVAPLSSGNYNVTTAGRNFPLTASNFMKSRPVIEVSAPATGIILGETIDMVPNKLYEFDIDAAIANGKNINIKPKDYGVLVTWKLYGGVL